MSNGKLSKTEYEHECRLGGFSDRGVSSYAVPSPSGQGDEVLNGRYMDTQVTVTDALIDFYNDDVFGRVDQTMRYGRAFKVGSHRVFLEHHGIRAINDTERQQRMWERFVSACKTAASDLESGNPELFQEIKLDGQLLVSKTTIPEAPSGTEDAIKNAMAVYGD